MTFAASPSTAETPAAPGAPFPGALKGVAGSNSSAGTASRITVPTVPASEVRSRYASTFLTAADNSIQLTSTVVAFCKGLTMRSTYEEKISVAAENARRIRQGADVIVRPIFADVAKLLWPHKTAAELASIAKRDERTAARWLSGEFEPPISVVLAVNQKIFGRRE